MGKKDFSPEGFTLWRKTPAFVAAMAHPESPKAEVSTKAPVVLSNFRHKYGLSLSSEKICVSFTAKLLKNPEVEPHEIEVSSVRVVPEMVAGSISQSKKVSVKVHAEFVSAVPPSFLMEILSIEPEPVP